MIKYNEYTRQRYCANAPQLELVAEDVESVVEACADAYGYLAGIDPVELGLAPDALSDRVAMCMDSIAEALTYMGVDIRNYVIK